MISGNTDFTFSSRRDRGGALVARVERRAETGAV